MGIWGNSEEILEKKVLLQSLKKHAKIYSMKLHSQFLKSFLAQELERTTQMLETYTQELAALPKGTLYIKNTGRQEYVYRFFREGDKVISKCLGNVKALDMNDIRAQINQKENLENIVTNLKLEQRDIQRILR